MAERRNKPKRTHNVKDQKINNKRSSLEIDILGAKAEVAMAKWLNTHVQQHIPLHGDDGKDLVVNGVNIQVKSTFAEKFPLAFPKLEGFSADVAVLCTEHRFGIMAIGWTTKDYFIENCTYRKLLIYNYCLEQEDLFNINTLERFLNK